MLTSESFPLCPWAGRRAPTLLGIRGGLFGDSFLHGNWWLRALSFPLFCLCFTLWPHLDIFECMTQQRDYTKAPMICICCSDARSTWEHLQTLPSTFSLWELVQKASTAFAPVIANDQMASVLTQPQCFPSLECIYTFIDRRCKEDGGLLFAAFSCEVMQ